jgi:hypothetical protein
VVDGASRTTSACGGPRRDQRASPSRGPTCVCGADGTFGASRSARTPTSGHGDRQRSGCSFRPH